MAWTELILVCGFAGATLGVAAWRRWHKRRHAGPARFEFRWQFVSTGLLGLALLALVISRWTELRGLDGTTVAGLSFLVVALVGSIYRLRRLRAAAREERRTASRLPRPPSFAAQAMLILLPLGGLVTLGVVTVRRDYRLTEQAAQGRAAEVARDLESRLGTLLTAELAALERLGELWAGDGVIGGRVHWPGASPLLDAERERLRVNLEECQQEWQRANSEMRPQDVFPVAAVLDDQGNLVQPPDYANPPGPAPWLAHLTPEQRRLWEALGQLVSRAADAPGLSNALAAFLTANPPADARANAEYLAQLGACPGATPEARVTAWLAAGKRWSPVLSEAGLPLRTLALMQAFRVGRDGPLSRPLFEELAAQVADTPSFLVPRLLDLAGALAENQPLAVREAVAALRARWEADERLRELARLVQARREADSFRPVHFWGDWGARRWWVEFTPQPRPRPAGAGGEPVAGASAACRVRFFPKPVLARALDRAVERTCLAWPRYLRLTAVLEGERLLPVGGEDGSGTPAGRLVLARGESALTSSGPLPGADERPGEALGREQKFKASPIPPRLTFELWLGDRAALYAQARQRAGLMGGFVLAAAAVAGLGLSSAHRAFRRQLRLNRLKSDFVSSVSHELRAPIASVRLLAESLERGAITDEARRREYFRLMGRECRRLSALIENVLDFARMEQGRKTYEFEPTDLPALVTQTVRVLEPYAAERQVGLRLAQPAEFNRQPLLDGRAVQQALVNLIDNAVKHSPPGAEVEIALEIVEAAAEDSSRSPHSTSPGTGIRRPGAGVRPPSTWIRLSVRDHGPGIPPAEQARIFEPFYRRGSELRRETSGVGIGLSLVKHIVEAHAGRVWVDSEPGRGSRFVLELPVREPLPAVLP